MATATKSTNSPNLSERDQSIIEELMGGDPRGAVAQRHGLTPERVRQISNPFSADIQKSRDGIRQKSLERNKKSRMGEIKTFAKENPSMRPAAIAAAIGGGVVTQDVIGVIGDKDALRRDQIRFTEDPVFTRKFTDEECFVALRAASKRVGKNEGKKNGEYGVLTMVLYSDNSGSDDPKRSTIQKRFGTWQTACEKAGVPSGDPIPRRVYAKKWSHEDMVAIMKRFFTEKGVFGSMRDYSEWAREVPKTPTVATVRAHFGSWTKVKEIAAEMAEADSK